MIEIEFHSAFKKKYKKLISKNPDIENKFWTKVELFQTNPFNPILKTHKLSGILKDLSSFSIDYDLRVIFYFVDDNKAIFVNIGTHDEVY